MKRIISLIKSWFKPKVSNTFDIKSKICLMEIAKTVRNIETDIGLRWQLGYKRDAFLSLEDKMMLDPLTLANEFILIQNKKSELPKRERDLINGIVGMAIYNSLKK